MNIKDLSRVLKRVVSRAIFRFGVDKIALGSFVALPRLGDGVK
jgi:hypothetical protein